MKKLVSYLITFFLLIIFITACSNKNYSKDDNTIKLNSDLLEVHYIDVEQGDCTLIIYNGHAMLIDAGDNNKGTAIQMYLKHLGISTFDYIIGTHPDADHIGGLDVILYKFNTKHVLLPDFEKNTKTYDDVIQVIKEKKYKITAPKVGDTYKLGEASFTIIAPNREDYKNANDSSIGILLQHGDNRFLFTGDAEEEAEADILKNGINISANVYKVSHHGSKTASTEEFLNAVNPDYAVISCSEDNSYGHPHAEVLNELRARKIKLFRTDEQGTIIARSDGKKITWNCSPSESWISGEPTGNSSTVGNQISSLENVTYIYIINQNTKKFHLPKCKSVDDIADKNKEQTSMTREELLNDDYTPCKRCLGE